MRIAPLLLLLAGCPAPGGGDDTGESSGGGSSTTAPTTGEVVDRCADVVCGAQAVCDPHDGRCYCEPGFDGDADAGCEAHPDYCGDAELALGHGVCSHEVADEATWLRLAIDGEVENGLLRLGKFLAPIDPAAPLPTLFGDRQQYNLHLCMLKEAFADVLPGFTNADYLALVYYRSTRTMIAGSVYELRKQGLPVKFVFTVEVPEDASEQLGQDEVFAVYHALQRRFAIGELGYLPRTAIQQGVAIGWQDPGFVVMFNAGVHEPKPLPCVP